MDGSASLSSSVGMYSTADHELHSTTYGPMIDLCQVKLMSSIVAVSKKKEGATIVICVAMSHSLNLTLSLDLKRKTFILASSDKAGCIQCAEDRYNPTPKAARTAATATAADDETP